MKILILVDKLGTAIDRLARMILKHNPALDIKILALHPKRPSLDDIETLASLLDWCDLLDVHYWKSGEKAKEIYPDKFAAKKKILFHFNPYDLTNKEWNKEYDMVVVGNNEMHAVLPYAYLVPYGVDLEFFEPHFEIEKRKIACMSVSRIEGKKGVLEAALACKKAGFQLQLVGRVSDPEYMQKVKDTGVVNFFENAEDEVLLGIYKTSMVHICNSVDGFESGTLPILEAMAVGCPVVTRNIGHVPDLFNGRNMIVREGKQEDVEELSLILSQLSEPILKRLKEEGFETARRRDCRIMTRRISTLYHKVLFPNYPLASIIIPTKNNPDALVQSLVAATKQDYPHKEIVVIDSGDPGNLVFSAVIHARNLSHVPIKYIYFNRDGYTLAEARNRGVVESEGEVLIFCDDRIVMEPNATTEFVKHVTKKLWVWGIKDGTIKGFVENFSAIRREDFVNAGMFCERIDSYGGMTEELRKRFELGQGFNFALVDSAHAKAASASRNRDKKRKDKIESKYTIYKLYGK